ncbi:hypothetical protein MNBD_GAMMA02-1824, partial [hydrothermal vent metagenome]
CAHDKIRVKRGNDVIMVAASEIICLMAEDKYVCAHLRDQTLLLDQSLAEIEKSHSIFLRIHRNALINTEYLRGIHNTADKPPMALLDHTDIQPVISRRQLSAVKKLLKEL